MILSKIHGFCDTTHLLSWNMEHVLLEISFDALILGNSDVEFCLLTWVEMHGML